MIRSVEFAIGRKYAAFAFVEMEAFSLSSSRSSGSWSGVDGRKVEVGPRDVDEDRDGEEGEEETVRELPE